MQRKGPDCSGFILKSKNENAVENCKNNDWVMSSDLNVQITRNSSRAKKITSRAKRACNWTTLA